ncbi:sphingomyelin phosphodiesterase [Nodularia spumigena CS-586/05]|uniref:sphingomyelin phosphodiesterase n=1 Tax=Nodularia spumigena TaxID=70799 RepID=UPI00232A9210|nr:sphingomyelin phosphodiesterase [Nodularia spumigena]MDB9345691.1 sphingomyelin phosphodiesterase [Nodularia spumigena CS-588/06]MDB9368533.1 sphingomyelin phosphodiesterase [Nodularia spumigena CS-586/05]
MKDTNKIKIMTYNVMLLPRIVGDFDQKNRSKSIATSLLNIPEEEQPHIIIFTEMFSRYSDNIINALKREYPYYSQRLGTECSGSQWNEYQGNCSQLFFIINGGVLIMSKYPIEYKVQYVFKNKAISTFDYYTNKGAVYIKVNKEGHTHHIIGTHMQADQGNNLQPSVRNKQLKEIRNFIESLKIPKNEPVIVAGDFNITDVDEITNHNIQKILNGKYNLDSDYKSFSAITNDYTKCLADFMNYSLKYNYTLDYIVYLDDYLQPTNNPTTHIITLKSLTPLYWKYMNKKLPDTKGFYKDPSDHYPVEVEYHFHSR